MQRQIDRKIWGTIEVNPGNIVIQLFENEKCLILVLPEPEGMSEWKQ